MPVAKDLMPYRQTKTTSKSLKNYPQAESNDIIRSVQMASDYQVSRAKICPPTLVISGLISAPSLPPPRSRQSAYAFNNEIATPGDIAPDDLPKVLGASTAPRTAPVAE